MSPTPEETIETLQRAVLEIQALAIIYDDSEEGDGDGGDTSLGSFINGFKILSKDEFEEAERLLEMEMEEDGIHVQEEQQQKQQGCVISVPVLRLEVNLNITLNQAMATTRTRSDTNNSMVCICIIKMHITLPPGYPASADAAAIVSIVSITNLNTTRTEREKFALGLNEKSRELAESDCEAVMELIQFAQDNASQYLYDECQHAATEGNVSIGNGIGIGIGIGTNDETRSNGNDNQEEESESSKPSASFSRRWIWVHHITNTGRCKDIIHEARDNNLSGYLKQGYPGIVVVEGESNACDEYVHWTKGNKSRPGGFGRNWGHHVRGEETGIIRRAFENEFVDIGDDLADLAAVCRQADVEHEFKKYVLQH